MQLKDDMCNLYSWGAGLHELILNYFRGMFFSRGCEDNHIISLVPKSIDDDQNQALIIHFVKEEVLKAIQSMHPDKSPGPEGMNSRFYHKFCDITGPGVVSACLSFLNDCFLPEEMNDTSIVIIPKKKKPETLSDLWPLSLCNVIYKIVSVIANRLKKVLKARISPSQSAFTPGRFITDNVLIVFEIGLYLERKRRGKVGATTLKLDMSKSYDIIEWSFLKNMMINMGFHSQWVKLVMC